MRLVSEAVISNRLRPADFVDADDQGLEMVERLVHTDIHKKQNDRNDRQAKYADFQVKIGDHCSADLLNILTSGTSELIPGPRNLDGAHWRFFPTRSAATLQPIHPSGRQTASSPATESRAIPR